MLHSNQILAEKDEWSRKIFTTKQQTGTPCTQSQAKLS
jgi:hypothetical protein